MSATRSPSSRLEGPPPPDTAILARFPGRCPCCACPIKRGDLIVPIAGLWVHDDCDQATKDAER
jgi:hypothetical protein